MAGVLGGIYNSIVKRNAVFLTTIFAGAFATNIIFNIGADSVWDQINKGRQWKDIKQRYMGDQEEEDE
ncbi:qcr9 subunit 9 of the ubiquinol cytochrome-c reductase complex [Saxophila tyrrhenica]|uniref:Complex III subunit 9 n=1 Tax=Saxophila tyrrhenica TaxID=1690608 RepID=A0AAV9PB05_9PEZI|nr:qcr9 subunit 9 of the ubiquinol cytochrome-c reductase complex [Saxophila tyrrhenica]